MAMFDPSFLTACFDAPPRRPAHRGKPPLYHWMAILPNGSRWQGRATTRSEARALLKRDMSTPAFRQLRVPVGTTLTRQSRP